ncbi:MAG: hypothetical protein EXR05_06970 [Acetobacteraceae bacterium]|nr:hypothetical protein [Acetobacteraceae bacterium]MSP30927.1 hypothetical protein [Acetobacteraceae bacterium]
MVPVASPTDPDWETKIRQLQSGYAQPPAAAELPVAPTLEAQIDADYRNLPRFNEIIGIQIHPQGFRKCTKLPSNIEDGCSLLGAWIIPGL